MLPSEPADFQPYLVPMLARGANGLLVIDSADARFIRARDIYGPLDQLWSAMPLTTTPVEMPALGKGTFIAGKRFLVIGAGSLGSRAAELLAAAGAESILLVDPDTLEARNLRRHLCGVDYLGQFKATAVAEELRRRGFATSVEPLIGRAQVDLADQVRGQARATDIVMCFADSAAARQFANHCAATSGKPSVIADVQLRPEPLGEIVVTVPGCGGCFNCWRIALDKGGVMNSPDGHDAADYPDAADPAPSGLPMYQLTTVSAAACDLAGVALSGSGRSLKWLMALDKPIEDFPDLEAPRRARLEELSKEPSCEVCGR